MNKQINILSAVFKDKRIIGLIGEANSGKTNNLIFCIENTLKANPDTNIVVYGFKQDVNEYLVGLGCTIVDSLQQLSLVRDSLIVLDEFQRLKISDRRYKDLCDEFFDFIYHNNNWLILSSPNMSEFNKMICRRVQGWLVKSLSVADLVNGSGIKNLLTDYKGNFKSLGRFNIAKSNLLVFGDQSNKLVACDYVVGADSKIDNVNIFCQEKKQLIVKVKDGKKSEKKCQELVKGSHKQ